MLLAEAASSNKVCSFAICAGSFVAFDEFHLGEGHQHHSSKPKSISTAGYTSNMGEESCS